MADHNSDYRRLASVDGPLASAGTVALYQSVYIRPVIGRNGERLFVTHSADGVPISLDLTLEAALARARLQNRTAQALN